MIPDGGFQNEINVTICAFIKLALKCVETLVSSGKKKAIFIWGDIECNKKIKELSIFILSASKALNGEVTHWLI